MFDCFQTTDFQTTDAFREMSAHYRAGARAGSAR